MGGLPIATTGELSLYSVPHPLPESEFVSPLGPTGQMEEEQHLLAGEEVGGPNSDDCTEGLALCILGGFYLQ